MNKIKLIFSPFLKIRNKIRERNCKNGKHDLFEHWRFGGHWSIEDRYFVCKHCDYEKWVGYKTNYD